MDPINNLNQINNFSTPIKISNHEFLRKTEFPQKTPKFKKNSKLNSEYTKIDNLKRLKKKEVFDPEIFNDNFADLQLKNFKSPYRDDHRTKSFSSKSTDVNNSINESPFCKLLNDSEAEPIEKYQILTSEMKSIVK